MKKNNNGRQAGRLSYFSGLLAVALSAQGQTYTNFAASGSTTATVLIPAIPGQTARIVGAACTSDKSSSGLALRTSARTTPVTVANTNGADVNVIVNSTTGFLTNDIVFLQTLSGACATATIAGLDSGTNMTLSGSGFGRARAVGDEVHQLGAALTLKYCVCTFNYQGQCLFTANRGRPICAILDGTAACSIDSLAVRYDP